MYNNYCNFCSVYIKFKSFKIQQIAHLVYNWMPSDKKNLSALM